MKPTGMDKTTAETDACICCDDGPGLERGDGRHVIGVDPREMTADELGALGHVAMSPLRALRARCLDCCAGSASEVRRCTAVRCVSWPFRMGTSPWRKPISETERRRRVDHARRVLAHKSAPMKSKRSDAQPAPSEPAAQAGAVDMEHHEV
jgi:hypothetical protein